MAIWPRSAAAFPPSWSAPGRTARSPSRAIGRAGCRPSSRTARALSTPRGEVTRSLAVCWRVWSSLMEITGQVSARDGEREGGRWRRKHQGGWLVDHRLRPVVATQPASTPLTPQRPSTPPPPPPFLSSSAACLSSLRLHRARSFGTASHLGTGFTRSPAVSTCPTNPQLYAYTEINCIKGREQSEEPCPYTKRINAARGPGRQKRFLVTARFETNTTSTSSGGHP